MLRIALATSLLALTGAAPAQQDWSRTLTATTNGWLIGNPKAPRKLVEYLSLNCGHCAAVAHELGPDLRAAVRTGRTSWEVRPMGLFPHDVPATLLARCVPAPRRLDFIETYYRDVPGYTQRLQASQLSAAGVGALREASEKGSGPLAIAMADASGMKPIAAHFGLAGPAYARCLSDPKGHAWFDGAIRAARQAGVTGTPTFFVNGQRVTFSSMDELRAAILAR